MFVGAYMAQQIDEIGPLAPLMGYHLRRASGAFAADFAAAVEGTGMRQVLVGVLAVVSGNPGIKQGEVGAILGIKRANMVSLITELTEAGYLTREANPTDKRVVALHITDAGRAMLDQCVARITAHEQRMLAGFTDAEKATLLELLGRIERRAPALP